MTKRSAMLAAATLAAGMTMGACGSGDESSSTAGAGGDGDGDKIVRIGMSAALAGPYAVYDEPVLNGMRFAEKQINAKGGIDGYKVELVVKNNKGDQTQTAATTQELLEDGVKVFVLTAADTSIASGQLAAQSGAIVSVGGNSAPNIASSVGERAFMLVYADNTQAAAGAEYACEEGYRSAYLIGSDQIPYTKFIPKYFEDAFAKGCGGRITGRDSYKIGQTSFSGQIAKIAAADPQPDVIYTPMFVPDFGAFLKQLRSAGVTTPVVTVEGNATPLLLDSAGKAADGVVLNASAFPHDGNAVETFLREYQEVMGKKPESDSLEAIGRDNVYAIVEAAAAAGSTDPDVILDELYAFEDEALVTGAVTMNRETQIPDKDVVMLKVVDGEFTYLRTFRPKYVPAP